MISKFIREQKPYTINELCEIFNRSKYEINYIIDELKEHRILKEYDRKNQEDLSDLIDEDFKFDYDKYFKEGKIYFFTYVGIIVVAGVVLKCYPKYILNNSCPIDELKTIIKVIEKSGSKEQRITIGSSNYEESFNDALSVYLFLLRDYYENGIYYMKEDI